MESFEEKIQAIFLLCDKGIKPCLGQENIQESTLDDLDTETGGVNGRGRGNM